LYRIALQPQYRSSAGLDLFTITGPSHTILVQSAVIDGVSIVAGVYIGLFYLDNGVQECGGFVEWPGSFTSITAWGDDSTSPDKDGFTKGEAFIWKVWRASDGGLAEMTATYSGPPTTYTTIGMDMLHICIIK
jgi:hypothetical protein